MSQVKEQVGSVDDQDFSLWMLFDHTRFMISRAREIELGNFGLTPEQSHILHILDRSGGSITMNEILDITMRQHHSISTLITRMSKQGLIIKIRNRLDKRKFNVVITEKGRKLVAELTRESIKNNFSALSENEKKELATYLRKLLGKSYALSGKEFKPNVMAR